MHAPSNRISNEEPKFPFFSNLFPTRDSGIHQKPEVLERKLPLSPSPKSSSPTAVGLLLRSSMFRELVEKNSYVPDEEMEGNETKNHSLLGGEDEFGGFFDNGIGNNPYVNQSEETGKILWNGDLNMFSSIH